MMTQWFQMMILGNVKIFPSLPAKMTSVMGLMLGMLFCLFTSPTPAAGVVSTCDSASLTTALTGGGTVTFSCNGTITLASTITISSDTVIDGTGRAVTISGDNTVQVFYVPNSSVTLSLNHLTIANGKTLTGGGGLRNVGGTVNIANCTFSNNVATGGMSNSGGGILNNKDTVANVNGIVNIVNSTFVNNGATGWPGGSINNVIGSTLNIANSTFSNNSANAGGGINNGGTLNIVNSIVSGNTGGDINNTGTYNDQGNNLIGGTPSLASLSTYGGTSQLYGLLPGSPAIDAGNPTGCTYLSSGTNPLFSHGATITTDQRGRVRPIGSRCDIGAFESPNLIFTEIMYNPSGDENLAAEDHRWEWVEVYNVSNTIVNLSGYVFFDDDSSPAKPTSDNIASGSIAPNKSAILYNAEALTNPNYFKTTWGSKVDLIAVTKWPALNNSSTGDTIALWPSFSAFSGSNYLANAVEQVTYDSNSPWPSAGDSSDRNSIYLNNLTADNNDGNNWKLSAIGTVTPVFTGYQSTLTSNNNGLDIGSPGVNVLVTPVTLSVTEGSTNTFTMKLSGLPTANVTVGLSASSECTVLPTSITLTTGNWNTGISVTVTGTDDAIADGPQSCTITTAAATSSDSLYSGTDPADVTVTVTDNDAAGITVSPTTLTVAEPSGTATFNIKLTSQPVANVTISLSKFSNECNLSASSVTLNSSNWNGGLSVIVTAQDDAIADGPKSCDITTTADSTTADTNYKNREPADVTVTVNDDTDTAGITVSPTTLTVAEPSGSSTFNIKLTSQPVAPVTIGLSKSSTECTLSTSLVSPVSSVTLDSSNWNGGISVIVTAQDDAIADGPKSCDITTTADSTTTDTKYKNRDPANVTVTVTDNDTAGITVSSPVLSTISESGGTTTFTIKLNSQPAASATVTIPLISTNSQCNVSPTTVTLNNATWSTTVPVTIYAIDDAIDDGLQDCAVTLNNATSTDSKYNGLSSTPNSFIVSVQDNDSPGVIPSQSGKSTDVAEGGGTDTYTLALNTVPASAVTVTITTNGQVEVSENGTPFSTILPVVFIDNTAKIITVRAVDDTTAEGTHTGTITHQIMTGSGTDYPTTLKVAPVTVNITDNDATTPPKPPTPPMPPTPPTPPPVTPTDYSGATPISPTVRLFITIDGSGQGEVTSETGDLACDNNEGTCQAVYDFGTTVTLLPKAMPGSKFSSWGGHEKCVSGNVLMTGNILCIAFFRKQIPPHFPLTVTKTGMGTIASTPAGIDCGENCQNGYEEDMKLTLLATPDAGWQWVNWTGDCSGTSDSVTVTMRQAKSCTATFAQLPLPPVSPPPISPATPSYLLTVTKMGDGNGTIISDPVLLDCGTHCSGEWVSGTMVNLMVETEDDSLFTGWQGDCQGLSNSVTVTMDAVRNCIAVFDRLKPPVRDVEVPSSPLPVVQEEKSEENVVVTPEETQSPISAPVIAPVETASVEIQPPSTLTPVESSSPISIPAATVPVTTIAWDGGLPCPPTENWLDWVCNAHWATLGGELAIGQQGSLSHAIITGVVDSQGWVSNLKILSNAIVQGGIVTGYITNAGLLENIEFRGASLEGGELAGVILNTSKIGGTIQDVSLVANAYLRGGKLAGRIVGNPDAPALLEKLSVKAGSYLESVRIGEGVKMEKGVTLGEGVEFEKE